MKPLAAILIVSLLLPVSVSSQEIDDEESLHSALAEARPSSAIEITSPDIFLTDSLNISQNLTLSGRRDSKTTIVCPSDGGAIAVNGSVKLENLVFRDCNGTPAVIFAPESPDQLLEVINCEFRSNRLGEDSERMNGAAISVECNDGCLDGAARLEVSNSLFRGNEADRGGAIYAANSKIRITDSVFRNNVCNYGGCAIYARQIVRSAAVASAAEIINCTFGTNQALKVGLAEELTDAQGKRLEIVRTHMFQAPLATGGACLISDVLDVSFVNCSFKNNMAAAGGAASAIYDATRTVHSNQDNPSFRMTGCNFSRNHATHTERDTYWGRHEVRLGGALYMALNQDQMSVEIARCRFEGNDAFYGGAVHFVSSNSLSATFEECEFDKNNATMAGGAAIIRCIGVLMWRRNNATENVARQGGALYLTNNAGIRIEGFPRGYQQTADGKVSTFARNMARDGGAIMCSGCGSAVLQDPRFISNRASRFGGGIYVLDCAATFLIQHVRAYKNQALAGGAVAAESATVLGIDVDVNTEEDGSLFVRNMAVVGGAVYYLANRQGSNAVDIRGCVFRRNEAIPFTSFAPTLEEVEIDIFGDFAEQDEESLRHHLARACQDGGGGGVCLELSSVPLQGSASAVIERALFHRNNATVGGALYISSVGSSWNTRDNSACLSEIDGASDCRMLEFHNVTFTGNSAIQGGGATFVSDSDDVTCVCDTPSRVNQTLTKVVETVNTRPNANVTTDLFCTSFQDNSVKEIGGVYGPDVATDAFSLELVHPMKPVVNHSSGEFLICNGDMEENCRGHVLIVRDKLKQRITGGNPAASLELNVHSASLNGNMRYTARRGEINVNRIQGIASKAKRIETEVHDIRFEAMNNAALALETNFSFRDCIPGEISELVCRKCSENYYSFDPELECLACEKHANCTGGATLLPVDGYWHSSPVSPLFHECLVEEACTYPNRSDRLFAFYESVDFVFPPTATISNEAYPQCKTGYTGTLCGSCDDGYGRFSDGTCSHCQSNHGVTIVLMIALTLWIALLIGFELLTTLHTNHSFKELQRMRQQQQIDTVSAPSSSRRAMPGSSAQIQGAKISVSYTSLDSRLGIIAEDIPEHVAASERLTELIKIFVNFLQITSAAASMNLRWGQLLEQFLRAEEIVATATNGATYLPLECTLGGSIVALWSRVLFPFLLLLVFLALGCVYWLAAQHSQRSDRYTLSDLYTYFIVASIAVSFFAYRDVTEELMRTVSCLHLDSSEEADRNGIQTGHDYITFAVARDAYWAEDTREICWKGGHLLTGIFGILGLVFFSAGTVVFVVSFLVYNKPNLRSEGFISRYGFLYRSYKLHWFTIPWEGVIAVRKALVSAAIVFAFPLGPNLQAVMSLGVLILAQAAHLVCWPYTDHRTCSNVPRYAGANVSRVFGTKYRRKWVKFNNNVSLNHLESASLLVSTLTFYAGIVFYDNKTSDAGEVALTIFVVFCNFLYVFYMLYRVYEAFHVMINAVVANIQGNRHVETDVEFVEGEGFLRLVRRVNQLCRYFWGNFRGRHKPSNPDSPIRKSASTVAGCSGV